MKKIFVSLILCVFIMFFGGALFAQVHVSLPDTSVSSDTTITIPVISDTLDTWGILSFSFMILYNSEVLTATDILTAGTISEGLFSYKDISRPDTITFTAAHFIPISGGGVLVNLEFQTAPQAGLSLLVFDNFLFNEGSPTPILKNGSVGVDMLPIPVELSSFSGQFIYDRIELNWTTETEQNNYGFYVERAFKYDLNDSHKCSDTATWNNIGFVKGNGTTAIPQSYHFIDHPSGSSKNAKIVSYRLKQIDTNGNYQYFDPIEIAIKPQKFQLQQNYPNPFNTSTTISFDLASSGIVELKLYNHLGQEIMQLIDHQFMNSGFHKIKADFTELPSGVYFYRLTVKSDMEFHDVKKLILLK